MKKSLLITALSALFATPSLAKNTNEDWKWESTYYKTYGEWTTACENRADDASVKRCYLRYVDAYAFDPFGALFVFVTATRDGPKFSFEFESGTDFKAHWQVNAEGSDAIWSFDPEDCPWFGDCIIKGEEAAKLSKALAAPRAALTFSFVDREDRAFERSWSGDQPFADAFNDLQKQTFERSLNN